MKDNINSTKRVPHEEFTSRLLYLPRGVCRLEKLGELRSYPKNYVLLQEGHMAKYCYVVKRGRVIGYETIPSGEERVYNFNEENTVLLEVCLLFDQPSPVSFKTMLPSELVCIDKSTLMEAITKDNDLMMDILQSVSIKFLAAMDQVRQINRHNACWKICDLLILFAEHYGVPYDGKILIKEKISQQMISSLLGINRVTTVRVIKELKEIALIEQINGYYCIRSIKRIRLYQERFEN